MRIIRTIATIWFITAFVVMTALAIYQQDVIDKQNSAIKACALLLHLHGILDSEDYYDEPEQQEVSPEDKVYTL